MALNLLIVEDDEVVQETYRRIIDKARRNVTLTMTSSGHDAIELVRTQPYDGVILDLLLPGMSGIEVLARIREQNQTIPIIVSTTMDTPEVRHKTERHGVTDFVGKDRELATQLLKVIDRTLGTGTDSAAAASTSPSVSPSPIRHKRLLVVDDEPVVHQTIDRIYRDDGLEIGHAYSVAEALAEIHNGYSVVLSDIRMPDMDGLQLLRNLKRLDPSIEVVLMTGYASIETAMKASRYGALDYLTKPFTDLNQLKDTVGKAMQQWQDGQYNKELYEAIMGGDVDSLVMNGQAIELPHFQLGTAEIATQLMSNLNDGLVFTSNDGAIAFANLKFSQCVNHPFLNIIGKPFADFIIQEDRRQWREALRLIKSQRSHFISEIRLYTRTDITVPVMINLSSVNGGSTGHDVMMVITDLSAIRTAQQRIELLAGLVDKARFEGVLVFDPDGKCVDCNVAVERILGIRKTEVIGLEVPALFESEDGSPVDQHYFFDREASPREVVAVNPNQQRVPAEISIEWIESDDKTQKNGIIFLRDITERKRTETMLRQQAQELERSNQELEQFAYVSSHDLQEPLRKIQSFGARLRKGCADTLDDKNKDYLDRIIGAAERMRGLIHDLLALSRITSNRRPFEHVALREIMDNVMSDLTVLIEETGATITVGNLNTIEADPVQLHQLFQNLIGNALKFHRDSIAPVIDIQSRTSTRAVVDGLPMECEITVTDNGIGFDMRYIDRIFAPFQRLHSRNEFAGTGMGLAICRKIVERHSGSVTATSEIDSGTTFLVMLPVEHRTLEG